jgi:heptosyltransferase-2
MTSEQRILIVMPTWVGDMVMATPTLRVLRQHFADAHIALLLREANEPLMDAAPWHDELICVDGSPFSQGKHIAKGDFDLAVLLRNSFSSALACWFGGVRRIVGFNRDGRGLLLTERLTPPRDPRGFRPTSTLHYYLDIARHLGADDGDPRMELFCRESDDIEAQRLLDGAGSPLVLLNPGARYGAAKIWMPDRFAAVGDRLVEQYGATIAVTGAPDERLILDKVIAAAKHPIIDLPARGLDLRKLKAVVKRCDLMITNDTGPRHIAAAFGVPVVTLFGPTDPNWTTIDFAHERQVRIDVFCSPCQLKVCPLDHRCMTRITPDMVLTQAGALLERKASVA